MNNKIINGDRAPVLTKKSKNFLEGFFSTLRSNLTLLVGVFSVAFICSIIVYRGRTEKQRIVADIKRENNKLKAKLEDAHTKTKVLAQQLTTMEQSKIRVDLELSLSQDNCISLIERNLNVNQQLNKARSNLEEQIAKVESLNAYKTGVDTELALAKADKAKVDNELALAKADKAKVDNELALTEANKAKVDNELAQVKAQVKAQAEQMAVLSEERNARTSCELNETAKLFVCVGFQALQIREPLLGQEAHAYEKLCVDFQALQLLNRTKKNCCKTFFFRACIFCRNVPNQTFSQGYRLVQAFARGVHGTYLMAQIYLAQMRRICPRLTSKQVKIIVGASSGILLLLGAIKAFQSDWSFPQKFMGIISEYLKSPESILAQFKNPHEGASQATQPRKGPPAQAVNFENSLKKMILPGLLFYLSGLVSRVLAIKTFFKNLVRPRTPAEGPSPDKGPPYRPYRVHLNNTLASREAFNACPHAAYSPVDTELVSIHNFSNIIELANLEASSLSFGQPIPYAVHRSINLIDGRSQSQLCLLNCYTLIYWGPQKRCGRQLQTRCMSELNFNDDFCVSTQIYLNNTVGSPLSRTASLCENRANKIPQSYKFQIPPSQSLTLRGFQTGCVNGRMYHVFLILNRQSRELTYLRPRENFLNLVNLAFKRVLYSYVAHNNQIIVKEDPIVVWTSSGYFRTGL